MHPLAADARRPGTHDVELAQATIDSLATAEPTLRTAALTVCAPATGVSSALHFRAGGVSSRWPSWRSWRYPPCSASLDSTASPAFCFGLLLGVIGIDPLTGTPRLTLGIPQLLDGIDVVIVAVGLFAVGEVLCTASRYHLDPEVVMLRGSLYR